MPLASIPATVPDVRPNVVSIFPSKVRVNIISEPAPIASDDALERIGRETWSKAKSVTFTVKLID